ncbi:MAG: anti-sigma-F factor Fin family protein [Bacillus sp. (in: Bacteria)]|jgi:hypothetical protein|nr:anti-sigma-F factor Fin family protein [Bacillus sp. (in: firmicutes)]
MAIHYFCRHCGIKVGTIDRMPVNAEQIGIHKLNEKERLDMVSYEPNGNIHIKTICEDCQEALERNPDYYQFDFFIQ